MLVSTHFFSMVSTTTCHYGKCLPISSYKKHTRADYPYHSRNTTSTTLGVRMACVPMDYLNVEFFCSSVQEAESFWLTFSDSNTSGGFSFLLLFCLFFYFDFKNCLSWKLIAKMIIFSAPEKWRQGLISRRQTSWLWHAVPHQTMVARLIELGVTRSTLI